MLRIAFQGVVGFPIRTLLTILSLVVAIAGIVAVDAAAATIETTVQQRALLTGGPVGTFSAQGPVSLGGLSESHSYSSGVANFINGPVTRTARAGALATASDGEAVAANVQFVDPSLRLIRPFPIKAGVWIDDADEWISPRVAVNDSAARDGTSMGDWVQVSSPTTGDVLHLVVNGVVDDGESEPNIYVPINASSVFLASNAGELQVGLQFTAAAASKSMLKSFLKGQDSLTGRSTTWAVERTDTVGQLSAEVAATRSSFQTVGLLGLVGAIFAIANIGLSALKQRSSELSLRRALGASRAQITLITLLESQITAVAAGLIAIPVSLGLYPVIALQFGAPFGVAIPPFPIESTLAGIAIGMAAALAGSLPAVIRSYRVPVASVMRD